MDYEVYEGLTSQNRKKTYLVFSLCGFNHKKALGQAKRYFRSSEKHIKFVPGYVIKDELYLGNTRNAKLVRVAYYVW